jgi:hypothetical protein
MDYVGAPNVFAFRKIDNARGAVVPNTAIAVGNFIYYLGAEGFLVFNGGSVDTIGHEKIDRTILPEMDWEKAKSRCSVAHDSASRSVVWSLPLFIGGTYRGGNYLLGYNYELQRWWFVAKRNEAVFNSPPYTDDRTLDGPLYGALEMDVNSPTGLGDVNLDTLGGGASSQDILAIFDQQHQVETFTSSKSMTGRITTGDFEMPNNARALVRNLRPVYEGEGTVLASVAGRMNAGDPVSFGKLNSINGTGVIPARAAGRYQRALFQVTGDIEQFSGFDPTLMELGKR